MKASEFVDHIKYMIREYGDLPITVQDPLTHYSEPSIKFPYYTGIGPTAFLIESKSILPVKKEEDDGN